MADDRISRPTVHPLALGIRGFHHSMVSTINQRAVLTLVATSPGITNAEIARRSGLGPQTVSRFLADLQRSGLIRRGEVLRGSPGLPATPFFLAYESVASIGVAIAWNRCEMVLMDLSGVVREHRSVAYDWPDAGIVFADIAALYADLTADLTPLEHARITAVGVAVPDMMSYELGWLGAPEDVHAPWRTVDAAAEVQAALGIPARLYPFGPASAWSEHAAPDSPWRGDFLYIHFDELICSGMILDGVLWRGGAAGASLGHTLITGRDGTAVSLQDLASLTALRRRYPAGELAAGAAQDWIEDVAAALALTIANSAGLSRAGYAVIGGALPESDLAALVAGVRARLPGMWSGPGEVVQVAAGRCGTSAAAIGASYLPLFEQLFERAQAG